mmetsp:Transcript_6242/g.15752  ORF Transcript_6242/g.15752 Transcript_6242/m.15752 type:complete len:270 (-) Transcript_6242:99-908(-)|eukprot:CAMPEP_0206237956 /NCGR_PEP_ID=MMETSP0047_2-20121206/14551_1 /ASSEMBLY_ACC=CAM_ASM_000192 /TAXON_ID=195065 /ORGANISM="Chroomonas mesostigmatica_cf, Strain CCMP1168" /LENGTH=269 /DNA_ID=CAMNT_0053662445 /DNA_START=141 /DNA_END=950 /DNA_ORIENTATION=+
MSGNQHQDLHWPHEASTQSQFSAAASNPAAPADSRYPQASGQAPSNAGVAGMGPVTGDLGQMAELLMRMVANQRNISVSNHSAGGLGGMTPMAVVMGLAASWSRARQGPGQQNPAPALWSDYGSWDRDTRDVGEERQSSAQSFDEDCCRFGTIESLATTSSTRTNSASWSIGAGSSVGGVCVHGADRSASEPLRTKKRSSRDEDDVEEPASKGTRWAAEGALRAVDNALRSLPRRRELEGGRNSADNGDDDDLCLGPGVCRMGARSVDL